MSSILRFDDLKLLSLAQEDEPQVLCVPAELSELDGVISFIEEKLEGMEFPMKAAMAFSIAAEEIFVNIAHYAYKGKNAGSRKAWVIFRATGGDYAHVTFVDEGIPYDPLARPDPDVSLAAEERDVGGLGIFMVKKSMDSVVYRNIDGRNRLTISKRRA
ncbi:MAG: ATP-binding protein [Eubacteriales bacterium]|nr:ATP-binding protein [Eubacteriales bacterium]MDD3882790.1 ATP-binding protein [Eubacteriales bacterium]